MNVAVSNTDGKVKIYENSKNSESNVVVHDDTLSLIKSRWGEGKRFGVVEPKEVISKAIDSYEFSDVDFIKIDVEMYTAPVLEGMIETLKNNSPILQIEADDVIDSKITNILSRLGFKKFEKTNIDWFYKK